MPHHSDSIAASSEELARLRLRPTRRGRAENTPRRATPVVQFRPHWFAAGRACPAPSAPGMGVDLQPERRLSRRVTRIVVKPKAPAGDRRAGGRVNRRDDRTNRNGQRGRVRAMSVLGTTKSNRHRKAHQVESGGTARKSTHPARGGLPTERWAGVSRGHSSEEGRESGWSEGPKARRDFADSRTLEPLQKSPERPRKSGRGRGGRRWIPADEPTGGGGERSGGGLRMTALNDEPPEPRRVSWIRFSEVHPRQPPDARKPHVRWCGRGDGRNPVPPTRSEYAVRHS